MREFPMAYFGSVDAPPANWRSEPDDFDPDDEELAETPPDVIAMLGFDPSELYDDPADPHAGHEDPED